MYFVIGGHCILIKDKTLQELTKTHQGFSVFYQKALVGMNPLLTVQLEKGPEKQKEKKVAGNIFLCRFSLEPNVECTFWRGDDYYLLRVRGSDKQQSEIVVYEKEKRAVCAMMKTNESVNNQLFSFFLLLIYGIVSSAHDTMPLHAAVVKVGGKAVLFLGESGTGKSTHARFWKEIRPKSCLLNDDNPVVRIQKNKVWVYGSPWSGKTPCYRNEQVEVAAIVRLNQAAENKIERLTGKDALCAVLPSFPLLFNYDTMLSDRLHSFLSKLLLQTPVYSLGCLPESKAAELVNNTLIKDYLL